MENKIVECIHQKQRFMGGHIRRYKAKIMKVKKYRRSAIDFLNETVQLAGLVFEILAWLEAKDKAWPDFKKKAPAGEV